MSKPLPNTFFTHLTHWNQAVCDAMAKRNLAALAWHCSTDLWPTVRIATPDPRALSAALRGWGLFCSLEDNAVRVQTPPDEVLLHTLLDGLSITTRIIERLPPAQAGAPKPALALPVRVQPHDLGASADALRWLSVRVFGAVCEGGALIPKARRCLILWSTPWGLWAAGDLLKPSLKRLAGTRALPLWRPGAWRRWRGHPLEDLPKDAAVEGDHWPNLDRKLAGQPALQAHQAALAVPVLMLGDRTLLYAAGTGRQLHQLGGTP